MSDSSEEEYQGEYEDLDDDFDSSESIDFPLFEHKNPPQVAAQGALKSYHVQEDGTEIYADQQSDYSVSVQRLLWVDGYERIHRVTRNTTTGAPTKIEMKQEATLVVLKMLLSSLNPEQKFQYVKATLTLEDSKVGRKNHPEIQAWAPFRTLERWNATVGHRETTKMVEVGAKGGYNASELSAGVSREGKISWDQTHFDEGHSSEMTKDGKRNGVTWFVKQNRLEDQGVTREIWVSALFSRSSRDPYLVNFNIYAHAGKLEEIAHKSKKFFGFGPGRTKTYSVTPWKKRICNHEGKHIIECINLDDLGHLREKDLNTSLKVTWGPAYQIPSPASSGIQAEGAPESRLPELVSGGSNPNMPSSNIDYTRLVALEGRVAQTEARIAAQDMTIVQLQRESMAKDVRLVQLEHAIAQLTAR
ncbi:hypothetical protein F4775DRAFT_586547 [Biscogniauxia sp. FL1348]|nr:hypothetical protein F4775DRAFT_586547 [Biscogniauxia sp. FL1348]